MAKRGNEKLRLLAVARILESGQAVSISYIKSELLRRYEIQVDRKTLYDDISVIDKVFPIQLNSRGRNSYYKRVDVIKQTEVITMDEHTEEYKSGYAAGYKARLKEESSQKCKYNDGIICNPEQCDCSACGWNPKIAKARLDKLLSAPKFEKKSTK